MPTERPDVEGTLKRMPDYPKKAIKELAEYTLALERTNEAVAEYVFLLLQHEIAVNCGNGAEADRLANLANDTVPHLGKEARGFLWSVSRRIKDVSDAARGPLEKRNRALTEALEAYASKTDLNWVAWMAGDAGKLARKTLERLAGEVANDIE